MSAADSEHSINI